MLHGSNFFDGPWTERQVLDAVGPNEDVVLQPHAAAPPERLDAVHVQKAPPPVRQRVVEQPVDEVAARLDRQHHALFHNPRRPQLVETRSLRSVRPAVQVAADVMPVWKSTNE